MDFDPAIAAQQVFARVRGSTELGSDLEGAIAAEDRFSNSGGKEASEAYRDLVEIGKRHPDATGFGEFLVYITWCHLMDETYPEHFKRGLALCQSLLQRDSGEDPARVRRLQAMEASYRAGLGSESEDLMDFDVDTPRGGD